MDGPRRIVSLVPSLTELIWWLGAGDALVGRTRFCVEPAGAIEGVPVVGGTKNPRVERIVALAPDLVVANREENRREDVEALESAGLDVLLTDPNAIDEALAMIVDLGRRLGCRKRAGDLVADVQTALGERRPIAPVRVLVVVWKEPLMGLGAESYGHDLIERAGGVNVLRDRRRYPELSRAELPALRPDLVLLPDEPYPFKERDVDDFAEVGPARIVDGKTLWWYGPRMPGAVRALRGLFAAGGGELRVESPEQPPHPGPLPQSGRGR